MRKVLVAVALIFAFHGCLHGIGGGRARQAARSASKSYDRAIAKHLRAMAAQIERGRLRGQAEERNWLAQRLAPARDRSFSAVYRLLWPHPGRPDERKTADAARRLAKGFE